MKIALIGYGKMGHAVEETVNAFPHTDNEAPEISLRLRSGDMASLRTEDLAMCDVAIEFTNPESAVHNIRICLEAGLPVVCGTTGWYDALPEMEALCSKKNGALLYAPNFSEGVHLFFALNTWLAKLMKGRDAYSVFIRETHHTGKKDAPSGTAIRLAENILPDTGKKRWVNEETNNAEDLYVQSIRKEDVPGTHEVVYIAPHDEIRIEHKAFSRMGFASGALKAAFWLQHRKGVFTMQDVLGL